jgi:hypothetical protein
VDPELFRSSLLPPWGKAGKGVFGDEKKAVIIKKIIKNKSLNSK